MRKRVLLDENLPHALRNRLLEHDTITAAYAGLAGYKNGELLNAATKAGFEVLVTGDQTLVYEQNLVGRKIAVVCLSTNAWQILKPFVARIVAAVDAATPGSFTRVDVGAFSRGRKPSAPELP